MIFAFLFFFIIFTQFSIINSYQINNSVKEVLKDAYLKFDQIQTLDDFRWAYLSLLDVINDVDYFAGGSVAFDEDEKYSVNNLNYLISPLRCTQRRMELVDNESSISKKFIPKKWSAESISFDDSESDSESTDSFGDSSIYYFNYDKDKSYNKNGGFTIIENVFDTDYSSLEGEDILNSAWLDDQTASLVLDFVVYNAYLEMLMLTRIVVDVESSGRLNVDIKTDALKRSYYAGGLGVFRAF